MDPVLKITLKQSGKMRQQILYYLAFDSKTAPGYFNNSVQEKHYQLFMRTICLK